MFQWAAILDSHIYLEHLETKFCKKYYAYFYFLLILISYSAYIVINIWKKKKEVEEEVLCKILTKLKYNFY